MSKKDFRRYQAELEQRCRTALAAGISVEAALESPPEKALLPAPKKWREGLGCVFLDGKTVWFDMRDPFLPEGGEALVLTSYGPAPVADPLRVVKTRPVDPLFMPFGSRTAMLEERPMEGGIGRIATYVIGSVIAAG